VRCDRVADIGAAAFGLASKDSYSQKTRASA
jgi:hypothetical protein